jgi:hypothetical protein
MVKQQIKLPRTSIRIIKGIEEIERHPLLELAEQTPVYVIAGKVYAGKDEVINEVGTIESLDELAMTRIEPALEEVRQAYTSEVWKQVGLERRLGSLNLSIPSLIDAQVFPYLRAEAYKEKVLGLVGEIAEEQAIKEEEKSKLDTNPLVREVVEEVESIKKEVEESKIWEVDENAEKKRTRREAFMDGLFDYDPNDDRLYERGIIQAAVGRKNFAIINGEVRYLVNPGISAEVITPDGRRFDFGKNMGMKVVDEKYRNVVSLAVRKQVLETKFSEEEIRKVVDEKTKGLGRFEGVENYEEEDFGFRLSGGHYFVYVKVPEFVMKCPYAGVEHREVRLETYYHSAESQVGVFIRYNGQLVNEGLRRYYPGSDRFDEFCIGNIKLAQTGDSKGEVIAKNLLLMRKMLLTGHSADWYKGAPQYNPIDFGTANQKINAGVLSLEGIRA